MLLDEQQLTKNVINSPDYTLYLDKLLAVWYDTKQLELSKLNEPRDIYRCQGEIALITRLRQLKDRANA